MDDDQDDLIHLTMPKEAFSQIISTLDSVQIAYYRSLPKAKRPPPLSKRPRHVRLTYGLLCRLLELQKLSPEQLKKAVADDKSESPNPAP